MSLVESRTDSQVASALGCDHHACDKESATSKKIIMINAFEYIYIQIYMQGKAS